MVLSHLPAWIATSDFWTASGDHAHLLRWVLLTLSQLYFVLKYVDAPWLRLSSEHRALVALVVMVALLHAGVVQRACTDAQEANVAVLPAAVAGGTALLLARRTHSRLAESALRARAVRQHDHAVLNGLWALAEQAVLPPRYLRLARACCVNRAPPR